jgi:S1-C subfamily serine protease
MKKLCFQISLPILPRTSAHGPGFHNRTEPHTGPLEQAPLPLVRLRRKAYDEIRLVVERSRQLLKFVAASLLIVPIAFGQTALTTAQIAKKVSPSVVVIQGKTDSGAVLGSGFIVSKDGQIVTNLHVIRDMKMASVQLANGEIFDPLSVLATDERHDLAVVQIAGLDLPVLELGDSDVLTVGEPLVIVGSPRGLEGTVTAGILSSVRDSGEGFKVLQTDAAVNLGNSGGPLVNNKGQAIGVVSFKLRSAEGLNFAVPINYVSELLGNLHDPVTLERMRMGLGAKATPQQGSGTSLNETLDWLKEKIPLATVQYVRLMGGWTESVNVQSKTWSFDSCTVEFGYDQVLTPKSHSELNPYAFTITSRFTVPLGKLKLVSYGRAENTSSPAPGSLEHIGTFISGEQWGIRLYLIGEEMWMAVTGSDPKIVPTSTGRPFQVSLTFSDNDEPLVQRVEAAFKHAADLCRGKEAF